MNTRIINTIDAPTNIANTTNSDKAQEYFNRAIDLVRNQHNLADGIPEFISAHRLGHADALHRACDELIDANGDALYNTRKKVLFQLMSDLIQALRGLDAATKNYDECKHLSKAITLCQSALNRESTLSKRFWENGRINKADLSRGTLLAIGKLLDELLEQSKNKTSNPAARFRRLINKALKQIGKENPNLNSTLRFLNEAIEIFPLEADAYFLRARVYLKKNELSNALVNIKRAIQLGNKETLILTAEETEEKTRQSALAAQYSQETELHNMPAFTNDDFRETLRYKLAYYLTLHIVHIKSLYATKNFAEAREEINKLLENFPNDGHLFHLRGDILLAIGDTHAAIKDYIAAADIYNAFTFDQSSKLGVIYKKQKPELFSTLEKILTAPTESSKETLATLSKVAIIAMLRTVSSLNCDQAQKICKRAIDPNTDLGARLHKQNIRRSLFNACPTESNSVKEAFNLYKANNDAYVLAAEHPHNRGKVYAGFNYLKEAVSNFLIAIKTDTDKLLCKGDYNNMLDTLKNATPDALEGVSKRTILHLLNDIAAHLFPAEKADLMHYAFQSDSNLCRYLNKSEGALFGLFAAPDVGLQRVLDDLKNVAANSRNTLRK